MPMTTAAQQILQATPMNNPPGVPEKYWELVEEFRGVLINQAFSILGNQEDAEDVVQETFCEAVRTPQRIAQARSLSAMLRSINRANALNRLRNRRAAVEGAKRQRMDVRAKTFTTGGFSLLEMREALAKAFEKLPPESHKIMVLRYWESLSFEEIAKRTGMPITTVWRLHYEAAMRLYDKLNIRLDAPKPEDAVPEGQES